MWVIIAAILVLVITAVALLEVYDSYKSGNQQMTAQAMQQQVSQSISVVLNTYAQNPNFTGFGNAQAQSIGAIPSSWTANGTTDFVMPNGGTMSYASANVNGGTNNGFSMTFSGLSQQQCVALATFSLPQMYSVSDGTTTFDNPAYVSGGTWPPVPATVAGDCAAAGGNTVKYQIMG